MAGAREVGEFGLIERIRGRGGEHAGDVVVGIGDDCAVLRRGPILELLTTDSLVEGTHYQPGWMSWEDLGWKTMAVNVSDVAAMGGEPRQALVTLFLPEGFTTEALDQLYTGLESAGSEYGVTVAGGDIVKTAGPFAVSLTLSGVCERDRVVLRSGARKGDIVCVTGALGGAGVGLSLLREGRTGNEDLAGCIRRFRRPAARLIESRMIVSDLEPTAMIDLSDGLLSDLWHILDSSRLGAILEEGGLPVEPGVREYCGDLEEEALSRALSGGEDYELLFTVNPGIRELLAPTAEKLGIPITVIGEITARGSGLRMAAEGGPRPMGRRGFDHFRREE
jgi:thiamine-monophosphate kinase